MATAHVIPRSIEHGIDREVYMNEDVQFEPVQSPGCVLRRRELYERWWRERVGTDWRCH
jgi:hypothetical protein